ncbi:MAG: hypothetical protein K6T75_08575 [Acetobacteraceae bacterium]|nr:hypothetical protein [Acetobacteraceae bacterium]
MRLKIEAAAPLSPGGGGGVAWGPYRPVFRRGGRPVLPGSSLKGRVRRAVEALARDFGIRACQPQASPTCGPDGCPVCRMFGSPRAPGGLRFWDTCLEEAGDRQAFEARSHVGLMRGTGSAYPRRLWLEERVGTPGCQYEARITGIVERFDLGLLLAALRQVEVIGGSGSRGTGWVTVRPAEVQWGGHTVDPSVLVKDFLAEVGRGAGGNDPPAQDQP